MEPMTAESEQATVQNVRRLFMVLSPRSLPYARLALESLFRNCIERLHISHITDSNEDKETLEDAIAKFTRSGTLANSWAVYDASDLEEREQSLFGSFNHLREFRRGHPCWRKITDPLLLSSDDDEMIVLDPDVYFPNRFRFEQTPRTGVLLMWQKPSCLLPPEVVQAAIDAGVRLAHHVDIGVAQWRLPVDLDWLNWFIGRLGSSSLPRSMHVEAIVWAALAMRLGGGYLNSKYWLCWHRTQFNRLLRKFGVTGSYILRRERLAGVKCFHAGGEAKWWLAEADAHGILEQDNQILNDGKIEPFIELMPAKFHAIQRNRRWLRKLGYYSVFQQ